MLLNWFFHSIPIKVPANFYSRNLQDESKMSMKRQRARITFIRKKDVTVYCLSKCSGKQMQGSDEGRGPFEKKQGGKRRAGEAG